MKLWAHRGCSLRYPENTMTSFTKAAELFEKGLTEIELDIQLTSDKEIVVIHDETVDRTTDGKGFVRDFSLSELKALNIDAGSGKVEHIPTMKEVFELLAPQMEKGFLLNIELKNSVYPYDGMEKMIVDMVKEYGLKDSVIFSTFYAKSLERLYELDETLNLAILDTKVSDCIYKLKGGCRASMLHPYWQGIDVPAEELQDYSVRAWMSGYLYPTKPSGNRLNFKELEDKGITDMILNEPEVYLG